PNWGEVLQHTAIPHFLWDRNFFALTIAIIGTTVAPWMIFFGQNNVVEKGTSPKEISFQRADVFSGAVVACLVVWFIIITTGTVLHSQGVEVTDAESAANALAPIAGPYAKLLFGAGFVGASFLAGCVLPLVTSYAICEAFGWERGTDRSWSEAPLFKGIITAIILVGCIIVLVPNINLMGVMLSAQVINGVLLPVLLIFLVIIINNHRVMGKLKNGRFANILSYLTIGIIITLTAILLIMQLLGMG
ncbi:MAG: divalent metal cation transporter, partial [Coriobacteriales bacterium]|nr:divalent metal cation transporter [Coriobacteriales bacterium]